MGVLTYRRKPKPELERSAGTVDPGKAPRPKYDTDTLFVPLTRADAAALLRGIRTETATEALAYALGISGGGDAA